MLKPLAPAFLCVPNEANQRVLNEAVVSELDAQRAIFTFDNLGSATVDPTSPASLAPGQDVMLYAVARGRFLQQGARVTAVVRPLPGVLQVHLETVGEPVSADQRSAYRVSGIALNAPVKINAIAGCILADLSSQGLGVIVPKPLTIGSTVEVSLEVEGFRVAGRFRVQGFKQLPSGQLRFGLYMPDVRSEGARTLEKLAGHMQRMQLKRLSGAA